LQQWRRLAGGDRNVTVTDVENDIATTHDDVTPLSEQLEKLERGQTDRVINNTIN